MFLSKPTVLALLCVLTSSYSFECKPPSLGSEVVVNARDCLHIAENWQTRADAQVPKIVDMSIPPKWPPPEGHITSRTIAHVGNCFVLVRISQDIAESAHAEGEPRDDERAPTLPGSELGQKPITVKYAELGRWLSILVNGCFVREAGNGYASVGGRLANGGWISYIVEGFNRSPASQQGVGDVEEAWNRTIGDGAAGNSLANQKRGEMVFVA